MFISSYLDTGMEQLRKRNIANKGGFILIGFSSIYGWCGIVGTIVCAIASIILTYNTTQLRWKEKKQLFEDIKFYPDSWLKVNKPEIYEKINEIKRQQEREKLSNVMLYFLFSYGSLLIMLSLLGKVT